jgi:hypothetical protein
MMEATTMPTVCLRFRFEEHPKIRALMEACADIQRQAVDYALENGKTATFTIIQALYPSLRAQHPDLHSNLIYGAIRSGARIVHGFRNRQRKGKTQADRPEIRRPSVYLVQQTARIEWDGETLTSPSALITSIAGCWTSGRQGGQRWGSRRSRPTPSPSP